MRIAYSNHLDLAAAVITAASEAADLPVSNVQHPHRGKVYRTGVSAAAEWVKIDLGGAQAVQCVILLDHTLTSEDLVGVLFHAPFDDPADPLKLNLGTGTLTFTRATTATYVSPATGLITTAANGVLRIEANGALIEGARTNLALQSEVMGTTWAASNVTVADNSVAAPDGNTTADTLTASAANGTLLQTIAGTAVAYTFSIYLKRKTGTGNVDITADGTTWVTQTINSTTWTRCTVTATLTVADYTPGIRIVTNADAVYAWGGQMELGAFASSYIPTTTAAVTRNKDALTFPTSGNFSDSVGSVSATLRLGKDSTVGGVVLSWGASTRLLFYNGLAKIDMYDGTNNPGRGGLDFITASTKVAAAWNGGLGITGGGQSVIRSAYDGSFSPGADFVLYGDTAYGYIKDLRIWNRALTDAEMVAITGGDPLPLIAAKLQGNATDVWTAPSFEQALTYNAGTICAFLSAAQTYQWWRVIFTKSAAGETRDIGRIFLGPFVECTSSFRYGDAKISPNDLSETDRSLGGQTYSDIRSAYDNIKGSFYWIDDTQATALKALADTVGTHTPFFLSIDPTNKPYDLLYYGKFAKLGARGIEHTHGGYRWSVDFEMDEEL